MIGGNVVVTGGTGDDTVNLITNGPLTVGKSMSTNLGGGDNQLTTIGNTLVAVGDNFSYSGSGGSNTVDFAGSTAQLQVGGSVTLNFGTTTGADLDFWNTGKIAVGHNFTVKGGSGDGLYEINWIGPNQIGGNLALQFGTSARNQLSAAS